MPFTETEEIQADSEIPFGNGLKMSDPDVFECPTLPVVEKQPGRKIERMVEEVRKPVVAG